MNESYSADTGNKTLVFDILDKDEEMLLGKATMKMPSWFECWTRELFWIFVLFSGVVKNGSKKFKNEWRRFEIQG